MKLNQNKLTTQIKELEEHKKCFLAQISSAKVSKRFFLYYYLFC